MAETREPAEIRQDIEDTREQLGDTVEALAEKTDVKAHAQEAVDAHRTQLVVAGPAAAVLLVALVISRRRR